MYLYFTQECFMPTLFDIGPMALEQNMKIVKSLADDEDRQRTIFDQMIAMCQVRLVTENKKFIFNFLLLFPFVWLFTGNCDVSI